MTAETFWMRGARDRLRCDRMCIWRAAGRRRRSRVRQEVAVLKMRMRELMELGLRALWRTLLVACWEDGARSDVVPAASKEALWLFCVCEGNDAIAAATRTATASPSSQFLNGHRINTTKSQFKQITYAS